MQVDLVQFIMRVKSLRKSSLFCSIGTKKLTLINIVCIRLKPSDLAYVKECVAAPTIPLEVRKIDFFGSFVQQRHKQKKYF